jgi:hypothetical protein
MATQGVFSIMENSKVKFKIVTGNDGMLIINLKNWFSKNQKATGHQIYEKAKSIFGEDNLVVQLSKDMALFENEEQYLKGLYEEKFEDPQFNPRWAIGTSDHVSIFKITN